MTDKEALKLALEALELWSLMQPQTTACAIRIPAITAIKKALAEHAMREVQRLGQEIEQEPVAWVKEDVCDGQYIDGRPRKIWWECNKGVGTAFYTTPPQRTEQEPYGYVSTHTNGQMHFNKTFNGVYRDTATEVVAVYTESTQRTEQEPVAWLSTDSIGERHLCFDKPLDNDPVQPLYTAPPQRTWVGLNDDEIDYLIHLAYTGDEEFVQTIEAKLKEKNT